MTEAMKTSQAAWDAQDLATCQQLPEQLLDRMFKAFEQHQHALKSYVECNSTQARADGRVQALRAPGCKADLDDAQSVRKSALLLAARESCDTDMEQRLNSNDPAAAKLLLASRATKAQFTKQRVAVVNNGDVMPTHGVRDPALRTILGNTDLWTPGDDVAQWHSVSEEEFIYVLEQFLDNVDRFYGGLFRKYPIQEK
jgi:hypothetical protein